MTSASEVPSITVITATKNVGDTIAALYGSLKTQSCNDFEWLVIDGQSDDSTLKQLRNFSSESPWVHFVSEPDCGIYDAINKGIRAATGRYYVVAGADDCFDAHAIRHYKQAIERGADVILANVMRAGAILGGFNPDRAWLGHSKAFRGSHSVGMLFRKELHARYGMYSGKFPLLADGYFLKLLLKSKAVRFENCNFLAGTFAHFGASSLSKLQTLVETWQIQMITERSTLLQTILFFGKVIVRYRAVAREIRTAARP